MPADKPPLGITPKHLVATQRKDEIEEAIIRYNEAKYMIPTVWIEELEEINKYLADRAEQVKQLGLTRRK